MNARSEDDWNAIIDAWRYSPDGAALADPHGLRHRVMAESRRMTINMLLEYAVGLALVGFAAWRLATGPGLDDFVWGFALLWFTAMALQYASDARRKLWRPAADTTAGPVTTAPSGLHAFTISGDALGFPSHDRKNPFRGLLREGCGWL